MRCTTLLSVMLLALAGPLLAPCAAQHDGAVVVVLFSSIAAPYQQAVEGFRDEIHDSDVPLLMHSRVVTRDEPADILALVREKKPSVVLTVGARASKFAIEEIKDVPVVYSMVFGADQYSAPNATGVTLDMPASARLSATRRLLPSVKRIGLISSTRSSKARSELASACKSNGLTLVEKQLNHPNDFTSALNSIADDVDVFLMLADATVYIPQSVTFLLRKGLDKRFPVIGLSTSYTKAGAFASFDCSYDDHGRQAAEIALRIRKGEKAADIKPQPPSTINISLNLSVARRLGIAVDKKVLNEATQVYGK